MTTYAGWRRLAACAMIDTVLIVSAGAAMAAPVGAAAAFAPHLPTLLVLGIGMVSASRFGRKRR